MWIPDASCFSRRMVRAFPSADTASRHWCEGRHAPLARREIPTACRSHRERVHDPSERLSLCAVPDGGVATLDKEGRSDITVVTAAFFSSSGRPCLALSCLVDIGAHCA